MRNVLLFFLFCAVMPAAHAETIDLSCDQMAASIVQRLDKDGLLAAADDSRQRATDIAMSLCAERQQVAQQQHEQDRQNFIKHWLTEDTGGKPGNERLKKLKR